VWTLARICALLPRSPRPLGNAVNVRAGLVGSAALVALLAVTYYVLHETGLVEIIMNPEALKAYVLQWGLWGPLAIIGLMTLAVLVSPIPSAPIALAAGAVYGHGWGALYVLLGAQSGAMAAFAIARFVGAATVHRWFGERLSMGWIGSQNKLMGIVFVSRLLPFLSFDIVSYFAGLTVLSFWRFSLATLAGIAPSSFLLAHFGTELGTGEADRILYSVIALGGLTLAPFGVKLLLDWRKRRSDDRIRKTD
jgi:uncharacterized membrane protein YdjX (TVP38/TMEM64 family)